MLASFKEENHSQRLGQNWVATITMGSEVVSNRRCKNVLSSDNKDEIII